MLRSCEASLLRSCIADWRAEHLRARILELDARLAMQAAGAEAAQRTAQGQAQATAAALVAARKCETQLRAARMLAAAWWRRHKGQGFHSALSAWQGAVSARNKGAANLLWTVWASCTGRPPGLLLQCALPLVLPGAGCPLTL